MFKALNDLPDDDHYKPVIRLVVYMFCMVMFFQMVMFLLHGIVIYLKWWTYKVMVKYLHAAEEEQDTLSGHITEMKSMLDVIKTWWELNRIETARQKGIQGEVAGTVEEVKGEIKNAVKETTKKIEEQGRKIDTIPDKVADRISSGESSINLQFPKSEDRK